jgi:TP901 family phage tail tape measure protein
MTISAVFKLVDNMSAGLSKITKSTDGVAEKMEKVEKTSKAAEKAEKGVGNVKFDTSTKAADKLSDELEDVEKAAKTAEKAEKAAGNENLSPIQKASQKVKSLMENVEKKTGGAKSAATALGKVALTGLKKGLESVGTALKKIAPLAASAAKSLASMTVKTAVAGITAATVAVGGLGAASINVGKNFESAMSQVSATMLIDKSTAEGQKKFETLETAAEQCGKTTAFSATEAAEALNYLALAGYDADKAATALPTVLNLAGAGAMDLAAASDMVTDSMSALGIEATKDNLDRFADQLAKSASSANASVSQMGEAILTVGGTAKNLAGGTTELNTVLGLLANSGIKGAEGGTHLRNILLRLQSPTDDATAALNKLGVSVYDAQGKMRSLGDIFTDLKSGMEGMTDAQVDTNLAAIFNTTDLAGARALLEQCGTAYDDLYDKIENSSGAAAEMYAIQLDNLDGDLKMLQSAGEGLGVSFYKGINEPLRGAVQYATSLVGVLNDDFDSGGITGLATGIGDVLADILSKGAEILPQVVSMGTSILTSLLSGIINNGDSISTAIVQIITVLTDGITNVIPQLITLGGILLSGFADGIIQNIPQLITVAGQLIMQLVTGFVAAVPMLLEAAYTIITTLGTTLSGMAPQLITSAVTLIVYLIQGIATALPLIVQSASSILLSLAQGIYNNFPTLITTGIQAIIQLIYGIVQSLPMIIDTAIQVLMILVQTLLDNLDVIITAAIQLIIALAVGLVQAIPHLLAAIPKIIEAILGVIFTTDWINVGVQIVSGIASGLVNGITDIFTGGKGMVEEYASGINEGTNTAVSAANNFSSEVGSAITVDDLNMPDFGSEYATAINNGTETAVAAADTLGNSIGSAITVDDLNMPDFGSEYSTAINAGTPVAVGAAENLSEQISQAGNTSIDVDFNVSNASENVTKFSQTTASTLNDIETKTSTSVAKDVKEITDGSNKAVSVAEDTSKKIKNTFDKLDLSVSGENIINGLIKGMNNKRAELMKTAQTIADSVSKTMNKALDIHSPSRVMMSTGINIVKGLVNGIDSMLDTAELKALELAGAVEIDRGEKGLTSEDVSFVKDSAYTYNRNNTDNSSKNNVNIYLTQEIKTDRDAKGLAKETAKLLADELFESLSTSGEGVHA